MTFLGKIEKNKVKQMHGPFDQSWTFKRPQEAKLVALLKRNAKTKRKYCVFTINQLPQTIQAFLGPKPPKENLETVWKSLKPALKPGTTLGKSLKPVILIEFSNGWKKILLKSPVSKIFQAWCPVSRPVSRIFKRFQDFPLVVSDQGRLLISPQQSD